MSSKVALALLSSLLVLPCAAEAPPATLRAHLADKRAAIEALRSQATQPAKLEATVTAESRSGVRRLRIRDFQYLSDSDRSYAGYDLGPGSWDTLVGVLASAVAEEFVVQAAASGVELNAVDVVFTSKPEDPAVAKTRTVRYPRNLGYVAYLDSQASTEQLESLRKAVERNSAALNLVTEAQPIGHGEVRRTVTPAERDASLPPGLRDFLVEKRAAIQRRTSGGERTLSAHARVEPHTGIVQVKVGKTPHQFIHDVSADLGGYGLSPTVQEHLLGTVGTCLTHIFEVQAASRQVVLDGLELHIEGTLTPRYGRGLQSPSRFKDVRYEVKVESPASAEQIDGLRDAVEASCPLYNLLKDPQTLDGKVIRGRYSPET